MYDGDAVEDEVRQNARDQQHPVMTSWETMTDVPEGTEELTKVEGTPVRLVDPIPGLSTRQVLLIHNMDTLSPEHKGKARERRLEIVANDIAAINRFLPRLEEVRAYLATMATDDDETLAEAKNLSDLKLRAFEREVTAKLESLLTEQELKKGDT